MTKYALILDAGCQYHGQGGTLCHAYADTAAQILGSLGWEVSVTRVEAQWDREAEAEKVKKADLLLIQTPAWWMAPPWQLKRYEDEVFCVPGITAGDGRTRTKPDVNYGTGGLLKGRYMISCTWNAPLAAFTDPKEFFEGRGIDGVFFPLHKTLQFIGLRGLPTFMANDVLKNPTYEADMARFEAQLRAAAAQV